MSQVQYYRYAFYLQIDISSNCSIQYAWYIEHLLTVANPGLLTISFIVQYTFMQPKTEALLERLFTGSVHSGPTLQLARLILFQFWRCDPFDHCAAFRFPETVNIKKEIKVMLSTLNNPLFPKHQGEKRQEEKRGKGKFLSFF